MVKYAPNITVCLPNSEKCNFTFSCCSLYFFAAEMFAWNNVCVKSEPLTETDNEDEITIEEIKVSQLIHY